MSLYEIWNSIILDFFFKDHYDEDIFLSVDYDELLDYASQTQKFDGLAKKLNDARVSRGESALTTRQHISSFFRQIFSKDKNYSISVLLSLICDKTKEKSEIPQTMPLLALFMMPIANRPDLNSNNYYTKTTDFLREKNIIKSNDTLSCADFSAIKVALKKMWTDLEHWASKNNYNYHTKIIFSDDKNTYVAPFLAEAIVSATQRMLFKHVFYKAGLVVGQEISREQALYILKDYGQIITYNDKSKLNQKLNNYEGAMVDAFMQAYRKWDGTTIVITKTSENGNTKSKYEDEGIVNRLYISMNSFHGDYKFSLIANIHHSENYELFEYTGEFGDYEFYVDENGIADESKRTDEIIEALSNYKEVVFQNQCNKNDTLRYVPEDLIILEAYHSKFISKATINKGGHYFVLVKKQNIDLHQDWLNQNNAKLCYSHNLKNGYFLYEIESLVVIKSESLLINSSHKSIQLKSTIIVGYEEDVALLYQDLPAYFLIEGVDIAQDNVRAVFNSNGTIEEIPLQYNADLRLWKLQVINNHVTISKSFVIYVGSEKLSYSSYKFKKCGFPKEYKEISYNEFGEYQSEQSVFNGLSISDKINVNLSSLTDNMHKFGSMPDFETFDYLNSDFLLYAISSHSLVDKKFVDNTISALAANQVITLKEGLTNRIIDNYCRMGYINYAYHNNKHLIAVNKPTLIWLPSVYADKSMISCHERVSAELTIKSCVEKYFKFLLTGARTPEFIDNLINSASLFNIKVQIDEFNSPLYPQRILFWAETVETVRNFANENGIQFENCVYASSLLNKLSDVDTYIGHITKEESNNDYGGIQNSFCGYDYKATNNKTFVTAPQNIDKKASVITYFPGSYSRHTILWYNNKQYDIDLFWSYFVGMKLANHKVVVFDRENSVITMPKHIKLPMLYARALTMITGDIPSYLDDLRQYKVANNPFTSSVDGNEILRKLGQIN